MDYDQSLKNRHPSEFRGHILSYIGRVLLGILMTVVTVGLLYPWAVCMMKRWEIENTYIEGQKLAFDGNTVQLFGNYVKWWFFTLITLGIYSFWLHIKMRKWIIKHTYFA